MNGSARVLGFSLAIGLAACVMLVGTAVSSRTMAGVGFGAIAAFTLSFIALGDEPKKELGR